MSINYILLKIASRCNLDCSYCYWFRDPTVRTLPALMPQAIIDKFVASLECHLQKFRLPFFVCSFHGGEPTLFGAERMRNLLDRIESVGARTKTTMRFALTTNGALIDDAWIEVIRRYSISVAVSIDGPPHVHDRRRRTIKGEPSWESAVSGYLALCKASVKPTIISVCDPLADAREVLDHFFDDLGATYCDVLVPEYNNDDHPTSIAAFYVDLFDHWHHKHSREGKRVRILEDFVRGILGLKSKSESIGYAASEIVCLGPTGQLEPHDALRIAGARRAATRCNIMTNELADILSDPDWQAVRTASLTLCDTCNACRYRVACGGGHIAQRWSASNGYDNPSVYCRDFQKILDHIEDKLKSRIDAVRFSPALTSVGADYDEARI